MSNVERIAVVGLGYVGLPLAVALGREFALVGLDVDVQRVEQLRSAFDRTQEISSEDLATTKARWSSDPEDLRDSTFIIVTVPTPIDEHLVPDLRPLRAASTTIGRNLTPGAVVVFESTVYPGVTEEVCVPILERESAMTAGQEFTVGYSPERINPGDRNHTLDRVVKVIAGQDDATVKRMASVYGAVCTHGLHHAPSIRVAEAAKVIENTQRDLNIALMNELSLIFDRLGIRTVDVLAAAGTKWNFLPFVPGLVGGHCIGVDPYYLTYKAQSLGYHPNVILAGRRVNDSMGSFIAAKTIKLLAGQGVSGSSARVAVLGLTFKEDVPDLRNSRVPDVIRELIEFGVTPIVHDPVTVPADALHEYDLCLTPWPLEGTFDAVILAVPHSWYRTRQDDIASMLRPGGVLIDVKSAFDPDVQPWTDRVVWAL